MKSSGKRFEENWKKSIPKDIFYYRLRDNSNTWSNGTKTRFATSNICDCLIFDGEVLYALELKSTKGKSLPYNNIKDHQIKDLLWCSEFANVISGFVIEFDSVNECYFIEISQFRKFKEQSDRKSLPIDYCRENGLKIEIINKKVNRQFNIKKFLNESVRFI